MKKNRRWSFLDTLNGRRRFEIKRSMFAAQGGACHWCGEAMELIAPLDGVAPPSTPRTATFEHLIDRWDPKWTAARANRSVVLACLECNQKRSAERDKAAALARNSA